jgi:outer membrane protein W
MKKLCTLFFGLIVSLASNAQEAGSVLLKGYAGYTFADKVDLDIGHVDITGGFQWGGGLEYFFDKSNAIEMKYVTMSTKFEAYENTIAGGNAQVNAGKDGGSTSYLLFDYAYYFQKGSKATPYLGFGLGWGFVDTENTSSDGFAWDLKLGTKIKTGSAVTINLEAYLQSQSQAVGTDYYYYWGWVYPVTDYASTLQFGLGAVICYDFKAK